MNKGFKDKYFESWSDEEMRVEACPECKTGMPGCPLCNGLGQIVKDDDMDLPPEQMKPERGIKKKYGYNSGDDYVTGSY